MKLTIKIPDTFLPELFQNLPEYAKDTFRCTGWDYDGFEFDLIDVEEDKGYVLDREKAEKGFELFASMVFDGKLPGLNVSGMNMFDTANWDSYDMDALLQCCLLGDVIYG